jgi:hypothetical protein
MLVALSFNVEAGLITLNYGMLVDERSVWLRGLHKPSPYTPPPLVWARRTDVAPG